MVAVLNSKGRKEFYSKLREYFKLDADFEFDGHIYMNHKNKYYIISDKYRDVVEAVREKVVGLYVAEINKFGEIRLSIEGSQIIGPIAKDHTLKLTEEQAILFMKGEDIDIDDTSLNSQYYIVYYESETSTDYIGCAKVKEGKLLNFTPKSRRVPS